MRSGAGTRPEKRKFRSVFQEERFLCCIENRIRSDKSNRRVFRKKKKTEGEEHGVRDKKTLSSHTHWALKGGPNARRLPCGALMRKKTAPAGFSGRILHTLGPVYSASLSPFSSFRESVLCVRESERKSGHGKVSSNFNGRQKRRKHISIKDLCNSHPYLNIRKDPARWIKVTHT